MKTGLYKACLFVYQNTPGFAAGLASEWQRTSGRQSCMSVGMVLGEVIAGEHCVRALTASFPFLEVWLLGLRPNSAIAQLRATPHHPDVRGLRRLPDSPARSLHQGQPPSLGSHISCCFVTIPILTHTCGWMSQPGLGPPPSPQMCSMPWLSPAASRLPCPLARAWGWVLAHEALPCLTLSWHLSLPSPQGATSPHGTLTHCSKGSHHLPFPSHYNCHSAISHQSW